MADYQRIEALHRQLADERRRVVETAAESGTLPPKSLLAYLADLDGATLAVETLLDQCLRPKAAGEGVGAP